MYPIKMSLGSLMFGFLFFALIVTAQRKQIVSGAIWNDDTGQRIQAHGGCVLQRGNEWYWFGEDKVKGNTFNGISCYRSSDLATWTRLPNVLTSAAGSPLNQDMVAERPRVIFNRATNKFVMYFHLDDAQYRIGKIGIATSDEIDSGWTFIRGISPLNSQSRDLSLFQEDDGTAYVVFASDTNANLKLARLTEDYMDVEELVYEWKQVFWEATGIIKEAGVYHMIFSLQKGWSANANKVVKATNLAGPWSEEVDIADPKVNTYSSQNTYELTVTGTQATTHIFIGDRWVSDGLGDSKYIWQPLIMRDGNFQLDWHDVWEIDVQTGLVTVPDRGTPYRIPAGQSGKGPLKFDRISGTTPDGSPAEWCSIYYISVGGTYRTGQISVNGGPKSNVFYPPTSATISIPVPIKLVPGNDNLIDMVVPSGVVVDHIIV